MSLDASLCMYGLVAFFCVLYNLCWLEKYMYMHMCVSCCYCVNQMCQSNLVLHFILEHDLNIIILVKNSECLKHSVRKTVTAITIPLV